MKHRCLSAQHHDYFSPGRLRASPTDEKLLYLALPEQEDEGRKDPNAVGEVPRGNAARQINSRITTGYYRWMVQYPKGHKDNPPDKMQNNRKQ